MSEEEIINQVNILLDFIKKSHIVKNEEYPLELAIQGLLYLYNKEKEKNKKIEDKIKGKINNLEIFRKALPIRATEIERFIGELKDLLEK